MICDYVGSPSPRTDSRSALGRRHNDPSGHRPSSSTISKERDIQWRRISVSMWYKLSILLTTRSVMLGAMHWRTVWQKEFPRSHAFHQSSIDPKFLFWDFKSVSKYICLAQGDKKDCKTLEFDERRPLCLAQLWFGPCCFSLDKIPFLINHKLLIPMSQYYLCVGWGNIAAVFHYWTV